MEIIDNFPESELKCPICNTNKQGKCTLVPIEGTRDGGTCEAAIIHIDCIDLLFIKKDFECMLFQFCGGQK